MNFYYQLLILLKKKDSEEEDSNEGDDENINFMKEIEEYNKITTDFEAKNTNFIDYQQRSNILFNSISSNGKNGYSIKPKDSLECIYDINNPDRLVRCVSDTYFKTSENNYVTYTYGDTLNVVGFMSIPNFVNCWIGIYPHMTLSEKMKCKMM